MRSIVVRKWGGEREGRREADSEEGSRRMNWLCEIKKRNVTSIIFRELFLNPPCLISKFASENEYSSLAILRKTGNKARLRRREKEGREETSNGEFYYLMAERREWRNERRVRVPRGGEKQS